MSLSDHLDKDRRLVILRALHMDRDYRLNESVIQSVLDEFGHKESRDRIRSDLGWLEEQGLVTTSLVGGRVTVAALTESGAEVAAGRSVHHGVKRPSPGG